MRARSMRLAVVAAAATALVALAAAARPAAACSKRHQPLFELADLARDVAIVKVTAVPGHARAGNVALRVTRTLKGRRALSARETNTSCHTGFRRGRTALVFLAADRWAVGAFEGYVERPAPIVVSTVAAWIAATDARARVDVLVGAIAGTDRTLRTDAAEYLADEPALIAALTPAATAALVVAASTAAPADAAVITTVILRAHGDLWRQRVATKPASVPTDPGHAALLAQDLEALTDPAALADRVLAATGDHAPERIAAIDRCERVRGVRLAHFTSYARGRSDHGWKQLAEACRTGTPTKY